MDKNDRVVDWNEDEIKDKNRNGIDDSIEPPVPNIAAGAQNLARRLRNNPNADPSLSAGDVDAQWEAKANGDEQVAGSTPTPGQSDVQDMGRALGVTYEDTEELKSGEKIRERDKKRWELDPASSDDWIDRSRGNE